MDNNIEHELPLIPLRGLAIFPYMILNFDVGRKISLKALDAGALNEDLVFLTSQKEAETDEPTTDDFYHVGTICKIKQMIKLPGDTVRVLVEGISEKKGMYFGYSDTNKLINFSSSKELEVGSIVDVKITSAKTWSLDGEVVE